ncbi:putative nucleoside diphosphate-linked moiety X motif 22-like [Trypanosoma grayi]|uniref:putative nucleoside diphosphate-linked moiety X motif 22-like n=1 Tax=Trypanosoma grayi TaxID=71804 RepID=UPI0004F3FD0F|nr:putative nucleoside diphosphate-linked moiety X motif 22-like [Trypanosoma grayi]KEG10901.1 putative nucleoside diphosphate-linked moiety X motif 22-like [Trypanosoma grayi]
MCLDKSGNFETVFLGPAGKNPILQNAVEATVRCSHNRQVDASVDSNAIEATWEALTHKNRSCGRGEPQNGGVYNGLKFRLHGVAWDGKKCHLELGMTDYKTSIGTTRNIGTYVELAKAKGTTVDNYLSNALGVECFTVTSDGKGVLFRRSEAVSEYAGFLCFPGGHPEPTEILNVQILEATRSGGPTSESLVEQATAWFECVNSSALVRLFFDSAAMEVADELGVERSSCRNRGLISVVKNAHTRKPDICFWIELSQTASEVEACFNRRNGADAFESVPNSLMFIELNAIGTDEESVRHFVAENLQGNITPGSLACLVQGINFLRVHQ